MQSNVFLGETFSWGVQTRRDLPNEWPYHASLEKCASSVIQVFSACEAGCYESGVVAHLGLTQWRTRMLTEATRSTWKQRHSNAVTWAVRAIAAPSKHTIGNGKTSALTHATICLLCGIAFTLHLTHSNFTSSKTSSWCHKINRYFDQS